MYLTPKSKEVERIFDRLMKFPVVKVDPRIAMDISRYKKIRFLRSNDNIFIGEDRAKHKSIIFIPPSVKLSKNNGKFFFNYR